MTTVDAIALSDDTFDEVVATTPTLLVEGSATWCVGCPTFKGPIRDYVARHQDEVTFATLDVDQAQAIGERYSIMLMPALLLFRDGELVFRTTGGELVADHPKDALRAAFETNTTPDDVRDAILSGLEQVFTPLLRDRPEA